jgi:ABC-type phosphate transport system substrate-binding protein
MTNLKSAFLTLILLSASGCTTAEEDKRPTGETYAQILERLGDGMKENIVIRGEHASRTNARKHARFYTDLQPLADFPSYHPQQKLSGTIRVSGLYLHDGLIKDQWVEAFQGFHPDVKVEIVQKGTIASGAVDIQTGPRIQDRLREAAQYEKATGERLFELDWATGSYNVPGWSPGFVIFVHMDNPIANLTIDQLDGIFAGSRSGGWKGTQWGTSAARGPEKNIRTWGELGLTGEWADKPIQIYGRPLKYNIQLGFERKVFDGGDIWNENTREYSHEMNPDGTRYTSSVEMVKDMATDQYGIVFSDMGSLLPGIRAVPIGTSEKGPFVPITIDTLRDRSYPLFIEQWAQARLSPGKPLDPLVKEFMTFMLSREGQDAIQRDGKWITLPADRAAEMRSKLGTIGPSANSRKINVHVDHLLPAKWDGENPDELGQTDPSAAYYNREFELGALPAYHAATQVSGLVRMPASGQFMASTAGRELMAEFVRRQPKVRFELRDGDLNKGEVNLSIGRKWTSYFAGEFYTFQMKHDYSAREIQIATGSFDVPGWSPALAIFVGKDNPVRGLTIKQLDGIFGGPRRGGWVSTTFRRQAGRGSDQNIRSWSELGVTGYCADKPINVFIPPLKYHMMSVFERKVLVGGNIWNDNSREIPAEIGPDGKATSPSQARVEAVGDNRCGITFASPAIVDPDARMVPVANDTEGPYVFPTIETVQDRSYPLHLETYAYVDAKEGEAVDPAAREFLRFILSRDGQAMIQKDGKWLPLTAELAGEQSRKLD